MRDRVFGTESEYALHLRASARSSDSPGSGAGLVELLKGLNAQLLTSLEKTGRPRSGEFLGNGGRFYIDRGVHPEYATPECRKVRDLVAHEKSGDLLVSDLVEVARKQIEPCRKLKAFKNNADRFGSTYGCHENYLVSPIAMENIRAAIPFLVTRQIFCGAGKVAFGKDPGAVPYQISQRADYFNRVFSDRTAEERGIINTRRRELPRMDENRRLHIICGDSNLSEYAIGLKIGVTSLVLRLLEEGGLENFPELATPVRAMKDISGRFGCPLTFEGKRGEFSALDIQSMYLEKAQSFFQTRVPSEEEDEYLEQWEKVLSGLKTLTYSPETGELDDVPEFLGRRIDWIIKLWVLNRYREKNKLDWNDPSLATLDLQYHDLDPESGLYYRCLRLGLVDRLVDDVAIRLASTNPPCDTRAAIRGKVIQAASGKSVEVQIENWERVSLRAGNKSRNPVHPFLRNQRIMNALEIDLKDPFQCEDESAMERVLEFIGMWG